MPRPDKQINPGQIRRLDDEPSPNRAYTWTKRNAEPGTSEIEIEVDDLSVTDTPTAEAISKYESRGTAAHIVYDDNGPVQPPKVRYEEQWSTDRSIDGRTYTRSDTMTLVAVPL